MERHDPAIFLKKAKTQHVIDVRSEGEYASGHIPGAINIPVFNNEERKIVGTLYKQSGREASVLKGLEMVGSKLAGYLKTARLYAPQKKILVHCWRGGLRSNNMAWLFNTGGMHVGILAGGYKAYRRYIRHELQNVPSMVILGGKTGSGKTAILRELEQMGQQIINLEHLANHKGSAFGNLEQEGQPTNEQFENDLFFALSKLDLTKPIWIEDESRGIGKIGIPDTFFQLMRTSRVIFVDVPKKYRIDRLVEEYAGFKPDQLSAGVNRISKKLGGLNTKLALEALNHGDYGTAADLLLIYYDKAYLKGLSLRNPELIVRVEVEVDNPKLNAASILEAFDEITH